MWGSTPSTRSSYTVIRRAAIGAALLCATLLPHGSPAQDIRGRYVAKQDTAGTIYHTFPCTLFEQADGTDLTFDITYRDHGDGLAVVNFTYCAAAPFAIDSVRFESGGVLLHGAAERLYIEPERKHWKHRYSLRVPVERLCPFFDAQAEPRVTLHAGSKQRDYRVKRSAWRSYAPIGCRIFEMVRVNEAAGN